MRNNCIYIFLLWGFSLFGVTISIDDPVNDIIDELRVRGIRLVKFPDTRPYSLSELRESIQITQDRRITDYPESGIGLNANTRFDSMSAIIAKTFIWKQDKNLGMWLSVLGKYGNDAQYPTKKFHKLLSSDFERGGFDFSLGKISLLLGREKIAFGPGRSPLLVSGKSPPMDLVNLSYTTRLLKLSYFLTKLNNLRSKEYDYIGQPENDTLYNFRRFLAVHRIEFIPKENISLGFSEVVLFGGVDRTIEPYYLNPLFLYYIYQWNRNINDNYLWSFDSRWDLKNLSLYSEFLIDDFQYAEARDKEPNHIGATIGIKRAFPKSIFTIEYTRLSRWAYDHFCTWQRYDYLEYPIGHPLGPDFEQIYSKFLYHKGTNIDIHLTGSYIQKGEGRIDTPWPVPPHYEEGKFFPKDNFLGGTIESSIMVEPGISLYPKENIFFRISGNYTHIKNFQHKENEKNDIFGINLRFNFYL